MELKFPPRHLSEIALILTLSLGIVFGLRCWSCENAISQDDCRIGGRSVMCSTGEICATEVRYSGGWGKNPRIFKRCKQGLACENNRVQNNRPAWNPTQCNSRLQNSVCRCCCDSGNCNKFNLRCMKGGGRCVNLPTPKYGFKKCDSMEVANEIGTSCEFSCKPGFGLRGSRVSTCMKNSNGSGQAYNAETPLCHRISGPVRDENLREKWVCEVPPETPMNGKRKCSPMKKGLIARVCWYRCKGGTVLGGAKVRRCRRRGINKGWDGKETTCSAKCSRLPHVPMNGKMSCDGDGEIGTRCEFSCDAGFQVNGTTTASCISEESAATWDKKEPTCSGKPAVCEEIEPMEHRGVVCSDGVNEGSVCHFTCTDSDYVLEPRKVSEARCLSSGFWTKIPCCSRRCPPNAPMDVVFVLDSSRSVRTSGWRQMKSFVKRIIRRFTVSPDAAHFGAFRFNSFVDETTQILLNLYPDNKEWILNAIDEMPYRGGGTKIGKALKHAKDVLLHNENGNRAEYADLVVVMTDGLSTDNVTEISNEIRADGATIFALGIQLPNKKMDEEQLLAIAGQEENFMIVTQGTRGLTNQLVAKVSDIICGNRCS